MSLIASTFRRLREESGSGRLWAGLAITICLAGGGVVYQLVPSSSTSANLWVDTSGGTCTRNASPRAYDDASACGSLDAARDAAECGDTINIKAGTYAAAQDIAGGTDCSADPVIFNVPSGTASFLTGAAAELSCAGGGSAGCGVSVDSAGTELHHLALAYVTFGPNCDTCGIYDSTGQEFSVDSADNTTIDGNTFDGDSVSGQSCQNFMWPITNQPSTNPQDGITITNNTIRDFKDCGGDHSEGLYVGGYSQNVTISGNTFYNNGNSAHIFVTWCAPSDCSNTGNDPDSRDPKNICIKGNTFNETWQAFYDITVRQETGAPNTHGIYTDDNIKFDSNQSFVASSLDTGFGIHSVQLYNTDDNQWAADAYTASPC